MEFVEKQESDEEWQSPFPVPEEEKLSPRPPDSCQQLASKQMSEIPGLIQKPSFQQHSAISIVSIVEIDSSLELSEIDLDLDIGSQYLCPPNHERTQELPKQESRVVIARAFINQGYGLENFKQYLRLHISPTIKIDVKRYHQIAGTMVLEAFRRLQAFLRGRGHRLPNLTAKEVNLLKTLLLNCRTTLPPPHANYFLQVTAITYGIESTSTHQNQCHDLYNNIYRSLQKKIALLRGQRLSDPSSSSERPRHTSQKPNYSGQHIFK